jgi:hypothetical protein
VTDPRLDFWADRVLAEIAGLDEVDAFLILAERIRDAKQSMAAGRGPSMHQYTRVGRQDVTEAAAARLGAHGAPYRWQAILAAA